jgi:uroporphyrinogen decarboxylase
VDFWADKVVWQRLKDHFQTNQKADVLEKLEVDIRTVSPTYVGPPLVTYPDGSTSTEWGFRVRYTETPMGLDVPEYIHHPLAAAQTVEDVEAHQWPSADWWDVSDIQQKIETINGNDKYFIRCHIGSIFEWTWALRGFEATFMDLATGSAVTPAIFEHLTQCLIEVGEKVLAAADGKIDAVFTWDDLGTQTSLLISPGMVRRELVPRHRQITDAFHKYGVKVFFHSDGAVFPLMQDFVDMGVDVLNPLQSRAKGMDISQIKDHWGDKLVFHGAIDIQNTMPFGTVDEVRDKVKEQVAVLGQGGGYILCPEHYLLPDTPLENILALYDPALRNQNADPAA